MDAAEYKCPNCNADLKFDPISQKLSCEYCQSSFTVDEIKKICEKAENSIPGEPQTAAEEEAVFEEHNQLFHCASCGADIMCDDQQTALFCYYCHNPVILAGKLAGCYKPDKVIGFKLTKELAVDKFKNWIGKRTFVPKDFKSDQQLEKVTGLYVPFWVADCDVDVDYRESKIDDLLMESIEPFDYKELKDFSMSYLSGFFADKYDVDKSGVFPRIRDRALKAGRDRVHSSVSGYNVTVPSVDNFTVKRTNWQYMMLPVWFMTYKYHDKMYEFAINGQTGKLAGTPPLDKKKLKLFCGGLGAALALAVSLFMGGFF